MEPLLEMEADVASLEAEPENQFGVAYIWDTWCDGAGVWIDTDDAGA